MTDKKKPRASAYYELLRHPKWQRKRLEILERDGFACLECGEENKTIQVHHSYYESNLKPWEYPSDSLHSLCEDCHKQAQRLMLDLRRQFGRIGPISDVARLLGYAMGLEAQAIPPTLVRPRDYDEIMGVAAAFEIDPDALLRALPPDGMDGWELNNMLRARRGLPPLQVDPA